MCQPKVQLLATTNIITPGPIFSSPAKSWSREEQSESCSQQYRIHRPELQLSMNIVPNLRGHSIPPCMSHAHTLQFIGTQVERGGDVRVGGAVAFHQDLGGVTILNLEEVRLSGTEGERKSIPDVEKRSQSEGATIAQHIWMPISMGSSPQAQLN